MNSQQRADIELPIWQQHRKLSPSERLQKLHEHEQYEAQLHALSVAMEEPPPKVDWRQAARDFTAPIVVELAGLGFLGYMLFQMMRT